MEKTNEPKMYKSVHLQVTGRCNANCNTCYVQRNDEDFDIAKLDELPDALEYAIGGGESLLYPHLREIIQKLKDKGKYVAVTTNGTIKERRLNVDRIAISIDGHTQELHSVTHNTPLETVEETVRFYEGIPNNIVINHILRKDNIKFLEEFLKKHKERTVNLLLFKGEDKLKPDYEQINNLIPIIEKHKNQLLLDACLCMVLNKYFGCHYPKCIQGKYSIYINNKGVIQPCSNSKTTDPCKILLDYGDYFTKSLSRKIILYCQDGTTGAHLLAFRLGYKGKISHKFKGWDKPLLYILKLDDAMNVPLPYFLVTTKKETDNVWVDKIEDRD